MSSPTLTPGDVEAVVRRYLARVAVRYLPVLAAILAVLMVVVFTPTTSPADQAAGLSNPDGTTGVGGSTSGGQLQGGTSSTSGTTGTTGAPAGTTSGTTGTAGGTTGTSGATGGITPPMTTTGVSRGGVRCAPGARQVTWTTYAPPCVARYTGNNGGKTAYGVTPSTITLSYRLGNSTSDAAIAAATGSAAPPRDSDYLKDLQVYANYFNAQFELYGRKVVIKTFQGQGDYINEDQGQGGAQAQADGQTARGLGAFGDVTFQLRGSNPYWSSLAQQRVVAWGPLGFPDSYYTQHAPYWWSLTPSGTDQANWMGNLACQRLNGMQAIFSPDKTIAAKKRVFGLIHPENPEYSSIADQMKRILTRCGVKPKEATYAINVAQFQTQSQNIVAQMQAAGVTTILCYCDPVVPIFLGNSAQGQNYRPEWVQPYWGDGQAQQVYGGNWQGLMVPGATWPKDSQNEAYKVFQLASGGKAPAERYYAAAYGTLLQVYTSLQAAGPQLTATGMAQATMALPTLNGYLGSWVYKGGAHAFTPINDASIAYFDPTYTSNFNGVKGGYRTCERNTWFPFEDRPSAWGGPGVQLHCFGR